MAKALHQGPRVLAGLRQFSVPFSLAAGDIHTPLEDPLSFARFYGGLYDFWIGQASLSFKMVPQTLQTRLEPDLSAQRSTSQPASR